MISQHSPVNAGPSTSAAAIAAELTKYGSPLLPYAQQIYDLGASYGVDPAFWMGVCYGENAYGTVGSARTTYNWTSVSNALYGGSPVSGSRWGQYPSPQAGIEAFYRLITAEYYPHGQTDLYSIWWGVGGSSTVTGSHAYAPAFENSESSLDNVIAVMNRLASNPGAGGSPDVLASVLPGVPSSTRNLVAAAIVAGIVLALVD